MPRSSESPKSTSKQNKQPPRPPNAWILFRSDMSKSMPPVRPGEPRPAQALVSKAISKMWQEASPEVKTEYERRAEAAKLQHMIKFPEYRFAPMKKEEKLRIREEKKREKEIQRDQTRRGRGRAGAPYPYPSPANPAAACYLPESTYGSYGPSPPISAASSPVDTSALAENASEPDPAVSNLTCTTPAWPSGHAEEQYSSQTSSLSASWPDSQSQSSQLDNLLNFNLDMLPWPPGLEFDEHINGFVGQTANPSIFSLSFDSENMTSHPQGELNISFTPAQFPQPDFSNFNFDNMWTPTNMDPIASTLPPEIANLLVSTPVDAPTYNAEDFINFDPSSDATPPAPTPLAPAPAASPPITPPSSSSKKAYVPPAGANRAAVRRAGGYWPSTFTTAESNMDISPPRYSVSAN